MSSTNAWPRTEGIGSREQIFAAYEALEAQRHRCEVISVDGMSRDLRKWYLTRAKDHRAPEFYALLRDDLLALRREREQLQPKADESLEGILI